MLDSKYQRTLTSTWRLVYFSSKTSKFALICSGSVIHSFSTGPTWIRRLLDVLAHDTRCSQERAILMLLTLDKHNRTSVVMSALEDIVDSGDKKDSAKHGRRPVPALRYQHCKSIAET
jgi:hypothetical protein